IMKKELKKTTVALAVIGSVLLSSVVPASAQNRTVQHTANSALACVNSGLCPKPLSNAIRAWDRAGWEAGNFMNSRQGLPQVQYPGTRR
ncbi:hypothetical protein, partial [Yoonia vestfoldensis]|uniref:hypothetical protein n=1 Tax=Yoonia vestfoldensis TaxID=245188 RepID=UPI000477159B